MEFPTVDHRRSSRTVKSDPTTGTRLEALSMLATCFTSGGRTACNGKLASESVGYASKKPIPTSMVNKSRPGDLFPFRLVRWINFCRRFAVIVRARVSISVTHRLRYVRLRLSKRNDSSNYSG